jgi:hypothetical protein
MTAFKQSIGKQTAVFLKAVGWAMILFSGAALISIFVQTFLLSEAPNNRNGTQFYVLLFILVAFWIDFSPVLSALRRNGQVFEFTDLGSLKKRRVSFCFYRCPGGVAVKGHRGVDPRFLRPVEPVATGSDEPVGSA